MQSISFVGELSEAEQVPGRWLVSHNSIAHKPFQNWNNVLRFLARSQSVNRDRTELHLVSLGMGAHTVRRPIRIVLDHISGDEVIASFPEAGIAIGGNTATEAVQFLKSEISDAFDFLKKEPRLGPVPQHQLQVLGRYLGKKGRKQTSQKRS